MVEYAELLRQLRGLVRTFFFAPSSFRVHLGCKVNCGSVCDAAHVICFLCDEQTLQGHERSAIGIDLIRCHSYGHDGKVNRPLQLQRMKRLFDLLN